MVEVTMPNEERRLPAGDAQPASLGSDAEAASLLVDSAISHAEKLRRVLELEEWIQSARDNPALEATRGKWRQVRDQLLQELNFSAPEIARGPVSSALNSEPELTPNRWYRKVLRRLA
jgi:hypothetical protein